MNNFSEVQILDNFYQTSSFYPMPVVLIGTMSESGQTNLGPYSLCFPYMISGEGDHSMMLGCRENSNTAQNIIRSKVCSINFIPDRKKYMKNCVILGYPGETTEEKMENSIFSLIPSTRSDGVYPELVDESMQIFECRLNEDFPVKRNEDTIECHFVLTIEKIIMREKWKKSLFSGKGFPRLPIDYGYRNNTNFWMTRHSRPYSIPIPKSKGITVDAVQYAADRTDPSIKWETEACAKLVKVPRVFLTAAIKSVNSIAAEEGVLIVTPEIVEKARDKRDKEK